MKYLLPLLLLLVGMSARGQNIVLDTTFSNDTANVRIYQDPALNHLITRNTQSVSRQTNTRKKIRGYRIQIYNGNNREQAGNIQRLFIRSYSGTAAYVTYAQPNFRVRIGDFISRREAVHFLSNLQRQYPTAMIVPSIIVVK